MKIRRKPTRQVMKFLAMKNRRNNGEDCKQQVLNFLLRLFLLYLVDNKFKSPCRISILNNKSKRTRHKDQNNKILFQIIDLPLSVRKKSFTKHSQTKFAADLMLLVKFRRVRLHSRAFMTEYLKYASNSEVYRLTFHDVT